RLLAPPRARTHVFACGRNQYAVGHARAAVQRAAGPGFAAHAGHAACPAMHTTGAFEMTDVTGRRYDLLIFDWDGTLMDSASEIVATMQKAIQETGLPERSPDQLRDLIGLGLEETIDRLFPHLDPQRVRQWLSQYRQRYLSPSSRAPLFARTQETLSRLRADGYELAVATGKGRRGLDRALVRTATAHYFSCTRCADEAASKPAPDMVDDIL